MLKQLNDVILLIAGVVLLVVIVLAQCASGKRSRKQNGSKTKSKPTQISTSSTQSVKKQKDKIQKQKVQSDLEQSSRSLSVSKRPTKKEAVKKSSTDESRRSSKSESSRSKKSSKLSKKEEKSSKRSKKEAASNAPPKASKKQLAGIPLVAAGTPKDMRADGSHEVKREVATGGGVFKEQEQTTQGYGGLIEEKGEQDLILAPKNLRWSAEGGYQTVELENTTKDRLAIKTKCSDNELYRVNPVFGFIHPGQKLKVDIIRQKGPPKVDKMIFVSVHASKDDLFPKPLFKRAEESQKTAMLPLLVARAT